MIVPPTGELLLPDDNRCKPLIYQIKCQSYWPNQHFTEPTRFIANSQNEQKRTRNFMF